MYALRAAILFTVLILAGGNVALSQVSGDSFLHLGDSGYARRANDSVSDLDYSKSFAVEALIYIKPHSTSHRHDAIIQKGGQNVIWLAATSGFSLGLMYNQYETSGKEIHAKVGDGQDQAKVNSARVNGYVYAVMTWDAGVKTVTLYINGSEVGNNTNSNVDLASISNSSNLRIGKGEGTLRRDIFFVRLWGRSLSAGEVSSIWSNYQSSGLHRLPGGFDLTERHSEWLMHQTVDANGAVGQTHIKDEIGSNHMELLGGAVLHQGSGALRLDFPQSAQSAVNKAVTLQAAGGIQTLGQTITLPLHYLLQVDQTPSFDSSELEDSGWLVHYGSWQPLLKPNTQYHWRAKVRDSSPTPLESVFSGSQSFTTEGASDWFVRPPGASYGTADGSSYHNAWTSIREIVWGEQGLEAGDNLYICGEHSRDAGGVSYIGNETLEYVQASGLSDQHPITIRMDCPGDQGTLWGLVLYDGPSVVWDGPDANGVYRTDDLQWYGHAELTPSGFVWLDKKSTTTWTGDPGAAHRADGTTYIKTTDGSNPKGKIYTSSHGYRFNLSHSTFINFYKANFFNSKITAGSATHITLDSSHLRFGNTIDLFAGNDFWTIKNSRLHDMANGIYTHTPGNMYNLLVDNNDIYDIGTTTFYHKDAHAVGVQNGINFLIQRNRIWNTGEAIAFWSGNFEMSHNTVRYNFIKDVYKKNNTGGHGIGISNHVGVGKREGFKIHGNIVINTGLEADDDWMGKGLSLAIKDYIEVYNNVLINTYSPRCAICLDNANEVPANASIYNNIVYNPQGNFIFITGDPDAAWNINIDNNLYFPNADQSSGLYSRKGGYQTFTEWQAAGFDPNGLIVDPQFVGQNPQTAVDLQLAVGSPAIDSGHAVALDTDFFGNSIPLDGNGDGSAVPDIGAHEFVILADPPPRSPLNLRTAPGN